MKITVVYQYFGTKKSGWSTRFYDFTSYWKTQGHQIKIITSPYYKTDIVGRGLINRLDIEGIEVIVINTPDSNLFGLVRRAINALIFSVVATFLVLLEKSDKIISSSGPLTVLIPFCVKRLFQKDGLIVEHRDLWPDGAIEMGLLRGRKANLAKRFIHFCNTYAEKVVVCSDGMKDILNSRGIMNVYNIPHGCDLELLDLNESNKLPVWTNSSKVFLYSGSLGFMDAVEQVLLGFIQADLDASCQLVILGTGAEEDKLKEISQKSLKSKNIHFYGLVSKAIMAQWYRISHVSFVVFKNYNVLSTSSPNKYFDSLTFGVPVIQNTDGWMKSDIENYNFGYNVVAEDVSSMKKAIETSITDKIGYTIKKENAKNLAISDFSREEMAKRYLKLLERK